MISGITLLAKSSLVFETRTVRMSDLHVNVIGTPISTWPVLSRTDIRALAQEHGGATRVTEPWITYRVPP